MQKSKSANIINILLIMLSILCFCCGTTALIQHTVAATYAADTNYYIPINISTSSTTKTDSIRIQTSNGTGFLNGNMLNQVMTKGTASGSYFYYDYKETADGTTYSGKIYISKILKNYLQPYFDNNATVFKLINYAKSGSAYSWKYFDYITTTNTSSSSTRPNYYCVFSQDIKNKSNLTFLINNSSLIQNVKLSADIDYNNDESSGFVFSGVNSFKAVFDGDGHTISNMIVQLDESTNLERLSQNGFGFIRYASMSEIKNLCLENVEVRAYSKANPENSGWNTPDYVGGLVGSIQSTTIQNCKLIGCSVVAIEDKPWQSGNSNCSAGGLVGEIDNSTLSKVTDCYVECDVKVRGRGNADYTIAGGIVGHARGGEISNCFYKGKIEVDNKEGDASNFMGFGGIGGFICNNSGTPTIKNCIVWLDPNSCVNKNGVKGTIKNAIYSGSYYKEAYTCPNDKLSNNYYVTTSAFTSFENTNGATAKSSKDIGT